MLGDIAAVCEKEMRSMVHNPSERFLRLVRPILWLVLFGSVIKLGYAKPTVGYQEFMLPGILVNAVLITAISHGITLRWEADLGILSRMLVAPITRTSVVLGKALSSVGKAFIDGGLFLVFAWILQIKFSHDVTALLFTGLVVGIFVVGISSLGMAVAILLRSREAYVGVVGLIGTPALFASNSLYDLNQMPVWLRVLSQLNPATYAVDTIRRVLIYQSFDLVPLVINLAVTIVCSFALLSFAVMLFRMISR